MSGNGATVGVVVTQVSACEHLILKSFIVSCALQRV